MYRSICFPIYSCSQRLCISLYKQKQPTVFLKCSKNVITWTYGQNLETFPNPQTLQPPTQHCGFVFDYDKVGQCDSIQDSSPHQQERQLCCVGECRDFQASGRQSFRNMVMFSSTILLTKWCFRLDHNESSFTERVCGSVSLLKLVLPCVEEQ